LSSFALSISLVYQLPAFFTGILFTTTILVLVILMRIDQPNAPRSEEGHYIAPLVPLLPACGIFCNFVLAAGLDGLTWLYLAIYSAVGVAIYFAYGIRKSKL
jgi:APA family basic amino acid/polyamine antiporter